MTFIESHSTDKLLDMRVSMSGQSHVYMLHGVTCVTIYIYLIRLPSFCFPFFKSHCFVVLEHQKKADMKT